MNRRGFLKNLFAAAIAAPSVPAAIVAACAPATVAASPWANITLVAKDLPFLVRVPNELLRHAISAERLLNDVFVDQLCASLDYSVVSEKPQILT